MDVSRSPAVPSFCYNDGGSYEFQPHHLSPPVGSNYLLHLFKHPEDHDDEVIAYSSMPKRRDRLESGTGWGLELVEGFIPGKVWAALTVLLILGLLVFSLTCACTRGGDLQYASRVALSTTTVTGLSLVWAQVRFA